MTALYAVNREALAEAIRFRVGRDWSDAIADRLIDSGVVRVIDPADDTLVERLAGPLPALFRHPLTVRAVLRALVEDKP